MRFPNLSTLGAKSWEEIIRHSDRADTPRTDAASGTLKSIGSAI